MVTNHNKPPSIYGHFSRTFTFILFIYVYDHHFQDEFFRNKSNVDYKFKEKKWQSVYEMKIDAESEGGRDEISNHRMYLYTFNMYRKRRES